MDYEDLSERELERLLAGRRPQERGNEELARFESEADPLSDRDVYGHGMDLEDLTESEVEHLLAGRRAQERGNEELARFLSEVKAVHSKSPANRIVDEQLARIVEEAQRGAAREESGRPANRKRRSGRRVAIPRKRLALLAAAVALGVLLVAVALAAAGVNLPGVVRSPFDQFGVQLPNQARSGPEAAPDSAQSFIDSTAAGPRACLLGQQVANAASVPGAGSPAEHPCSPQGTEEAGLAPSGNADTERLFGQQRPLRAHPAAPRDDEAPPPPSTPQSQPARAIAEERSESGQETGQQPHSGTPTAEASSSGAEVGQQHAQNGQAMAGTQSQAGQHAQNGQAISATQSQAAQHAQNGQAVSAAQSQAAQHAQNGQAIGKAQSQARQARAPHASTASQPPSCCAP